MMHENRIEMRIKVNKDELLKTLQENATKHKKMFLEALEGYNKKVQEHLKQELKRITKTGVAGQVYMSYTPPRDMTSVYNTTINMLKWSSDIQIQLDASEFRKLVEDKWDWTDQWLTSNAVYSATIASQVLEGQSQEETFFPVSESNI